MTEEHDQSRKPLEEMSLEELLILGDKVLKDAENKTGRQLEKSGAREGGGNGFSTASNPEYPHS